MVRRREGIGVITYEPFTAGFTGRLVTFMSKDKTFYVLSKPYQTVTKGQAFVMEMNAEKKSVRMIPVRLEIFMRK